MSLIEYLLFFDHFNCFCKLPVHIVCPLRRKVDNFLLTGGNLLYVILTSYLSYAFKVFSHRFSFIFQLFFFQSKSYALWENIWNIPIKDRNKMRIFTIKINIPLELLATQKSHYFHMIYSSTKRIDWQNSKTSGEFSSMVRY